MHISFLWYFHLKPVIPSPLLPPSAHDFQFNRFQRISHFPLPTLVVIAYAHFSCQCVCLMRPQSHTHTHTHTTFYVRWQNIYFRLAIHSFKWKIRSTCVEFYNTISEQLILNYNSFHFITINLEWYSIIVICLCLGLLLYVSYFTFLSYIYIYIYTLLYIWGLCDSTTENKRKE